MSDVRHSYLPYSCGRHTTWRCHCGEVTSHGRRREGGRQSNRVPTSRYRRTLPPTPQEASPHGAGEADRSNRGLPQRSHTTEGFLGRYSVDRIWPRSTKGFRHPPTRRLVRRPHTIGDVAGGLSGAVDEAIELKFRTVPGFSTQWDRGIEHRRHLTPPTIDQAGPTGSTCRSAADRRGADREPAKPARLSEMIDVAERLGADTDFVRVDLYDVDGRVVFGELTSFPAGGDSPFDPESFNEEFGLQWTVPRRYR